MNQFPLWLRLSLLHPAVSILLLGAGKILQHTGSSLARAAYDLNLAGFFFNIPGVMVVRWLLVFAHRPQVPRYMLELLMVLLTWLFVIVPFCWLINRFIASNRSHE
jgi:hypothetical protein